MCGIVGLISRYSSGFYLKHAELFTNMLVFDSIRGSDSTGLFAVDKHNKLDILKGDADGYVFTHSQPYVDVFRKISSKYHIIIGHNRKATKGTVTPENAHPFKEDHIVLVHNGTIFNADELNKESEVDSHAITSALSKSDAPAALETIHGAYALVWYDTQKKTLNLARNKDRPLYLVEYPDFWAIASEPHLPMWLNRRDMQKETTVLEVPLNKILMFELDKLDQKPVEISYEEYKTYTPVHKEWGANYHKYTPPKSPRKPPFFGNAEPSGFKAGNPIVVKFDDAKDDEHGGQVVLGSPVVDGVIHANLICHYHITDQAFDQFYKLVLEHEYFDAIVSSCGTYRGAPVIYVRNAKPRTLIKTMNGEYLGSEDIAKLVAVPCVRCTASVHRTDLSTSFIKRKKDGSYKLLCPSCITESIANAQTRRETIKSVH